MNLTINVTNATLDDLTTIFYRLGEPGFAEVWETDKVSSLQEYIDKGLSLQEALNKFDEEVHKKIEELEDEPEKAKTIQKEINTQPVEKEEKLHLDGAPPERKEEQITYQMVADLGGKLALKGQGNILRNIIKEYKVKRIVELPEESLPAVYQKLKEVEDDIPF